MTNDEIIERVLAMDAAGLGAELTNRLIDEFRHQEVGYRQAGMTVSHKDRAQLVTRVLFERFVIPADPPAPPPFDVEGWTRYVWERALGSDEEWGFAADALVDSVRERP